MPRKTGPLKGGQQITVFLTTEQCKILKKMADAQEFPSTVTHVARKLLQDAINGHVRNNPA